LVLTPYIFLSNANTLSHEAEFGVKENNIFAALHHSGMVLEMSFDLQNGETAGVVDEEVAMVATMRWSGADLQSPLVFLIFSCFCFKKSSHFFKKLKKCTNAKSGVIRAVNQG